MNLSTGKQICRGGPCRQYVPIQTGNMQHQTHCDNLQPFHAGDPQGSPNMRGSLNVTITDRSRKMHTKHENGESQPAVLYL